jgi:hypothetical protein
MDDDREEVDVLGISLIVELPLPETGLQHVLEDLRPHGVDALGV